MKTSKELIYRIIVEEYLKEEGLQISESKVDDLIAHVKGGPRPDWMGDDERKIPPPPDVPKPEEKEDGDTYPMDIPHDDAPESEYSGFQKDSGLGIEDQLAALIQGMPPEEVADLFQAVFEKIPGVELSRPGDEDYPGEETLYSPGAEGRPTAGFKEELANIIKEELSTLLELAKEIEEQENNPWAICTASVGREDKEKYEKCVKSVKKQNGGKS